VQLLARIPIRLRLTLAFAVAMAIVFAMTGFYLYARVDADLRRTIDGGLRTRADDVAALVRQADSGLREGGDVRLAAEGESFAQVLDARRGVVDTTPQLGDEALLSKSELAKAKVGTTFLDRDEVPGGDDPFRLLAAPVSAQGRQLVIVVGSSVEGREAALERLLRRLLLGGPVALALASLLGYVLASAALRPVESMRREAEAISGSEPGRRLPVPAARDEIARLGETLNEMLARLQAALERERSFVSDASHELRTPLALLKTELELARRHARSRDELERALRSAAEETDRLAQLAEDLMVLARADQGRLPVRREQIRALGVLEGVAERFSARAAGAHRSVELFASPDLEVLADRLRLEQALGNLVENALRHGAGKVVLSAEKSDGLVEFHVRDEGPGFPESFLARAFERFSRADEARSGGGAGLGLAITEVIARAHGGAAYARNREAEGADVWLSVPAEAPEQVVRTLGR
jgi:two-component system, OmpR family, sensor kinase